MSPKRKPPRPASSGAAQDEDVRLMLRFQAGETQAFDLLVERNVRNVHALIYRFLGDPNVVDDITQDVFLRIFRTSKTYQPTAKFSTWLYRIVANLCFNVMRSRKKAKVLSLDPPGADEDSRRDVPDDHQPAPHDEMDQAELQRVLTAAIAELPENQRIAIVLNKYEDKNYEEIAEVLDMSTMAVKSLLSRARGNLRDSLARYLSL